MFVDGTSISASSPSAVNPVSAARRDVKSALSTTRRPRANGNRGFRRQQPITMKTLALPQWVEHRQVDADDLSQSFAASKQWMGAYPEIVQLPVSSSATGHEARGMSPSSMHVSLFLMRSTSTTDTGVECFIQSVLATRRSGPSRPRQRHPFRPQPLGSRTPSRPRLHPRGEPPATGRGWRR